MAQSETKLVTSKSLAVDAVLLVAFFAYMYSVLAPHVPSNEHKWIVIWGAITASCMTGVFWLALQMFRVVLRFQRQSRSGKS
jgi:hypothetical protein